jgi:hypothetical protein
LETTIKRATAQGKSSDKAPARLVAEPRTESPQPRFRTVLVPSCGWPTEASIPVARKRSAKR